MRERRRDDTTEPGTGSRPEERPGYYYDDATGYEVYEPEVKEEDEDAGSDAEEDAGSDGAHGRRA
jgi:hypothetical protein